MLFQFGKRYFRQSFLLLNRRGPNFYQVLGIKPSCSEKEIKTQYFQLAKKYHPDLNPDESARTKFEQVQKAYETLSDQSKRDAYDEQMGLGDAGQQQFNRGMAQARARRAAYSDDEYEDLSKFQRRRRTKRKQHDDDMDDDSKWKDDFGTENAKRRREFWEQAEREGTGYRFGSFQNAGQEDREAYQKARKQYQEKVFAEFDDFFEFSDSHEYDASRDDTRGADYKADLTISFTDAINGCDTEIQLNKRIICFTCKGRRADMSKKPRVCFECGGKGSVIGNYGIRKKCSKCDGCGCQYKTACSECEGLGVQRLDVTEYIYLPQGVKDGQKIRLHQLGHASDCYTSVPGDLLLTLNVKDSEVFQREEQTIKSTIPLTLTQAILGTKLTVDTVDGKLNIVVPEGTQDGDTLVLRNYGVWAFDPPDGYDPQELRGDHILKFEVRIQKDLTENQKEILKKIAELENANKSQFYDLDELEKAV